MQIGDRRTHISQRCPGRTRWWTDAQGWNSWKCPALEDASIAPLRSLRQPLLSCGELEGSAAKTCTCGSSLAKTNHTDLPRKSFCIFDLYCHHLGPRVIRLIFSSNNKERICNRHFHWCTFCVCVNSRIYIYISEWAFISTYAISGCGLWSSGCVRVKIIFYKCCYQIHYCMALLQVALVSIPPHKFVCPPCWCY